MTEDEFRYKDLKRHPMDGLRDIPVCETCKGCEDTCANVPSLRHCEAANRDKQTIQELRDGLNYWRDIAHERTEYPVKEFTLVHNNLDYHVMPKGENIICQGSMMFNPNSHRVVDMDDYHVIKKSDVDGDVMGALIRDITILEVKTFDDVGHANEEWAITFIHYKDTIKNVLIAQSRSETRDKPDPDTVRIPRKVLEEWLSNEKYGLPNYEEDNFSAGALEAINDVLNYTPTVKRDGEG